MIILLYFHSCYFVHVEIYKLVIQVCIVHFQPLVDKLEFNKGAFERNCAPRIAVQTVAQVCPNARSLLVNHGSRSQSRRHMQAR